MSLDENAGQKSHVDLILKYLKDKQGVDASTSAFRPFVTISRQSGAGGHLLAHVLLTDMSREQDTKLFGNWYVFDRELCDIIAQDEHLHDSIRSLLSERYRSEFKEYVDSLFMGVASQYVNMKKGFHIVRTLATLGKIIIVGRSAGFVARDLPGGVHVRLVARESTREGWLRKKLNLSKDEAAQIMKSQDSDRAKIAKVFFNRDVNDPLNYDVAWNSETMGMHEMSHAIIESIKVREAKARAARKAASESAAAADA